MRVALILALTLGLMAGCAKSRKRVAAPESSNSTVTHTNVTPIVTPTTTGVGSIASVSINPAARFAVVNFSSPIPAMGTVVSVYRRGLKVGEMKLTGPQRETLVVGDITAGTVQPGDEVREQ